MKVAIAPKIQICVGSLEISKILENWYLWGRNLPPKHQFYYILCFDEPVKVILILFRGINAHQYTDSRLYG